MKDITLTPDRNAAHPRTEQPQPLLEPMRRTASAPTTAHHDFLELCARSERGLPRTTPQLR